MSVAELKVSRILHAGYLFEFRGTRILFDPILQNPFSHNCYAFPAVHFDEAKIAALDFDAIFISHFHDDHCCFVSLNKLKRHIPIYMFCVHEEMFSLLKQLGFEKVHSLQINIAVAIKGFVITPRQALDADVDCLFQISAADVNILNVVDSWIDEDTIDLLARTAVWDLILWPFQTLRELEVLSPSRAKPAAKHLPVEWLTQWRRLNPKVIVPSSCQFQQESWSWYNAAIFPISYQQFEQEIQEGLSQVKVHRLDPSCSLTLTKNGILSAPPLDWVNLVGDQSSDYTYNPLLIPLSTSDIAKLLGKLTATQLQEVIQFCKEGIPQIYQMLEAPQISFFNRPRIWELNVYDSDGCALQLHYQICKNKIDLFSAPKENSSWRTDISAVKIYTALHEGEALTSMYMRINDTIFSNEVEKQLGGVELTEDPLVRCLFENKFGAYQQAQLKRLQEKAGGYV